MEILIEEKDVPSDIAQYLPDGIWDISAEEILDTIDTSTALGTVISVISAVFPEAMKAFLGLLGLLVISSVMASLRDTVATPAFGAFLETVSLLCVSGAAFTYTQTLFAEFEAFISQIQSFMVAVIPTMSALLVTSGEVSSSLVFSGLLSGFVTVWELVCASAVLPILSSLMCVYTVSKICGENDISGFAALLKNILTYVLGALIVVMSCVLAFQSVIAKSADNAAVKGVKFVLGNVVPIIGGALSDAVGTVVSSVGIVKSATGILGAIVICLIFAVPVVKLVIWKLVFDAAGAIASTLALKKESGFFADMSSVTAFMAAIMASVSVFLVIARTAVSMG